jgi:sugar phosphate permease
LTWSANVFQIIAYASRAFALYYAIQAAIAATHADLSRPKRLAYAALSALGVAITLLGTSVE